MSKELAIRILHYTKPGKADRTRWVGVMQNMLADPRVKVYVDNSGFPYDGLKNLHDSVEPEKPSHLMVLHHDILPCFDFIQTAEKLVDMVGDEPISFYSNNKAVDTALASGSHWIKMKPWYYSQAFAMPMPLMTEMVDWIGQNVSRDDRMSDDERMAMFFYYRDQYVNATAPSLVEHIGWNSTTVDYNRPMSNYLEDKNHRMARKFIGIDYNPADIDWTKGFDNPVVANEDWALEDCDVLFQRLLKPTSSFKQ